MPANKLYKPLSNLFNQVNASFVNEINWQDKKVLDFGGNYGRLLRTSNGNIRSENYTCIDVQCEPIQKGKAEYPDAQWIHSNAWQYKYNTNGDSYTKIDGSYDIIVCTYVLVHMTFDEIEYYLDLFKKLLNHDGRIILNIATIGDSFECAFLPWGVAEKEIKSYYEEIKDNLYTYITYDNKFMHFSDINDYNKSYLLLVNKIYFEGEYLSNFNIIESTKQKKKYVFYLLR